MAEKEGKRNTEVVNSRLDSLFAKGRFNLYRIIEISSQQKLLTNVNLVAMVLMAISALKMADELVSGSLGIILESSIDLLALALTFLELDFRFIRFLLYVYFLTTTIIHLYFAVIPSSGNRLMGRVTGIERILLTNLDQSKSDNGLKDPDK